MSARPSAPRPGTDDPPGPAAERTSTTPDLPEHDPRRTYVEFTLEPAGDGTLLRVVETGFAQLPVDTRRETYDSHDEGWVRELTELAEHVHAA